MRLRLINPVADHLEPARLRSPSLSVGPAAFRQSPAASNARARSRRDDVAGFSFRDDNSIRLANEFIAKAQGSPAQFGDVSSHNQHVIIIGGSLVAAITFRDHQKRVFILFHVAIREAAGPAEFSAANLEPYQIVRV